METAWALLSTEFTKLKRTATLWMSVFFPALLLLLAFLGLLDEYSRWLKHPWPVSADWERAIKQWCTIWAVAVVPVLVAVQTAGLASLEHAGKHWKQLYTLPIPRWSIFAAKTVVCGLLLSASFLIFGAGLLGLELLRSGMFHLNMSSQIPWGLMLRILGRAYLASGAVIAIQMWIGMRFAGFGIPVGAGLALLVTGSFLARFHLGGWWPWTMPGDSLPWGMDHVPASPIVSPLVFALLTVWAGWRVTHSEVD